MIELFPRLDGREDAGTFDAFAVFEDERGVAVVTVRQLLVAIDDELGR